VERQHYYVLLKWWQWQSGLHNPARPLYPAPSQQQNGAGAQTPSPSFSKKVRASSRDAEDVRNSSREEEGERETEFESEREEEDEEESPPVNVVTFPTTQRSDGDDGAFEKKPEQDTLKQVAHILRLSPDGALLRIVQDYRASPGLSLLGEADAAREWIDDPKRNKARKKMTPAFFRRWLKRECDSSKPRQEAAAASQQQQPEIRTASRAQPGTRQLMSPGAGLASQSLMDLERRYKASRDSPPSSTQQARREEGGQT
jgi:hypothetical protein